MMPNVILVLTCVASMGIARKVQGRSEREQGNVESKVSTSFAKLLLASKSPSLFNPSGSTGADSKRAALHKSIATRPSLRLPVRPAGLQMLASPTYPMLGLEDRAADCIEEGCSIEDVGDLLTELTTESANLAARQQSILVTISRLQSLTGSSAAAETNREEIERIIRSGTNNFASLEQRAEEAREAEIKKQAEIDAIRYDAEVSLQRTAAFWMQKGKEDAKAAAADAQYKSELDLQRTSAFWIEQRAKYAAAEVEAARYEAEAALQQTAAFWISKVQAAEARAAKAEAEAKLARETVPEIRALLDRLAPVAPAEVKDKPVIVEPEVKEKPEVKATPVVEPEVETESKEVSEDILPYETATVGKKSVQDLRAELAKLGQPTTGMKEDLEQRLESALNVERLKTKVWDSVNGAWVDAGVVPSVEDVKGYRDEKGFTSSQITPEDFRPYTNAVVTEGMSVQQLRSELSTLGLQTTGMREDLERRLEEGRNALRMKTGSWDSESETWTVAGGEAPDVRGLKPTEKSFSSEQITPEDFVPYDKAVETSSMSVEALREELVKLGLPTTGMREELEHRLEQGSNEQRMKFRSWDSESGKWVR